MTSIDAWPISYRPDRTRTKKITHTVLVPTTASSQPNPASIAAHLAALRRERGLSQRQLAQRLHVSHSLIEKVERGCRTATPDLVESAARALECAVTDLTGQPDRDVHPDDTHAHVAITEIRRAVHHYDLTPNLPEGPRPLAQLQAEVRRANRLRHHARLTTLAAMVPSLITELTAAVQCTTGDERATTFALLVEAYAAANQVAYKLGYHDLSNQLVDRIHWAASHTADPLIESFAGWMHAGSLRALDLHQPAINVLNRAWRNFDNRAPDRMNPRQLSLYGSLHLQAAMVEANAGHADNTRTHLTEAGTAAHLLRVDTDYFQLAFGPSNTAIYRVATAVELGDAASAITQAASIRLPARVPVERSAQHHVDLSRAWLWHGNRERALRSLLRAETLAPQQTRIHPHATETVRVLLRQDRRRSERLAGLAKRMHVTL